MKQQLLISVAFLLCIFSIQAKEKTTALLTPAQCEGINMPYVYVPQEYTPAPEGYSAFYISHLGRHGSRNPSTGVPAKSILKILKDAQKKNQLAPAGKQLLHDMSRLDQYINDGWGELSPLGRRQHQEIARRMTENFPSVFVTNQEIEAISSWYPRCINSMESFIGTIYRLHPGVNITSCSGKTNDPILRFCDVNEAYQDYVKREPWIPAYKKFIDQEIDSVRLIQTLFSKEYATEMPTKQKFVIDLFNMASIMSNIDIHINMASLFTPQEYEKLWESQNMRRYFHWGAYPQSENITINIAYLLLNDIMEKTDRAILNKNIASNLRFAHVETLSPLLALLGIQEAAAIISDVDQVRNAWNNYYISPMAANLQWIFFKNKNGDILLKVMLNEREVALPMKTKTAPYYKWDDVRNYYKPIVEKLSNDPKVKISTSTK